MHYAVMIIGEDIEKQLEPFDEQPEDKKYLKFEEKEESQNLRKWYEKYKKEGQSFDDYCKDDGYIKDEKTGKWGYMCNPNVKWDWWLVGGRWLDQLVLKDKKPTETSQKGEPSLIMIGSEGVHDTMKDTSVCSSALKGEVDLEKTDYVCYAILKDGVWVEHNTDKFEEVFATVKDDERITIVDCHI